MDPVMMAVATAVATQAADAAFQGGRTALAKLTQLIRDRFAREPSVMAALTAAAAKPSDDDRVRALAAAIERAATDDAGFGDQLRSLWGRHREEIVASEGGVINSNTGVVTGHLLQTRDIHGDVHLGT
jgi:hypothetical protein